MHTDNEVVVSQIIAINNASDNVALQFDNEVDVTDLVNADSDPIETAKTFDTTKLEDLQRFSDQIKALKVGVGELLWAAVDNLPKRYTPSYL